MKHAKEEQKNQIKYEVYVKNFTKALLNYLHMKFIIRNGFASREEKVLHGKHQPSK